MRRARRARAAARPRARSSALTRPPTRTRTRRTHTRARARRNPYYKNERKTAEAHLLHAFDADFYGAALRLVVTGFLRDEASFASLDALIAAIHKDMALARESLAAGGAFALDAAGDAFLAPPAAS